MLKVKICRKVNEEHKNNCRQYAHTYHYSNTICLARAFYDLPNYHKIGIILHELGHLAGARGENEADIIVGQLFGIAIDRIDSEWGDNLEAVWT